MANYHKGRDLEYDVIHDLRARGFETMRAASSAGAMKIDVLAVRPGRGYHGAEQPECVCHSDVLAVQAKLRGSIGIEEWNTLIYWSGFLVATPIMAVRGSRGTKVVYTELLRVRQSRARLVDGDSRPYVFRVHSSHGFPHS